MESIVRSGPPLFYPFFHRLRGEGTPFFSGTHPVFVTILYKLLSKPRTLTREEKGNSTEGKAIIFLTGNYRSCSSVWYGDDFQNMRGV